MPRDTEPDDPPAPVRGMSGPRPAPGPEEAATASSHWDPTDGTDLYEQYRRLRASCPVAHTTAFDSSWLLTRYADVTKAARNHTTFPSGRPFITHEFPRGIPLSLNPPEHTTYRRSLNRYFGAERMDELEPLIRGYAVDALAPLLDSGGGDLAADLAQIVPARGLCALLNMPESEWQPMMAEFNEVLGGPGTFAEKAPQVIQRVFLHSTVALVQQRRREPLAPERDLISGMLAAEIDGEPLAEETVIAIGLLMFAAGHDTTANAITSAICHLAVQRDDQQRLRDDPSLIPTAIEELLRLHPSLHVLARNAATDTEVDGVQIPAGELVGLCWASANRDAEAFDDPDRCIVNRSPNRHLSFGHGIHKCLGAPLARLEIRVVLEELLSRTSDFGLADTPVHVLNPMFNGFEQLPVSLRRDGEAQPMREETMAGE